MKNLVQSFEKVAFSGSRSCPGAVAAVGEVLPLVAPGTAVSVGCAKGVDAAVRQALPDCTVFSALEYKKPKLPYAAALALRSAACMRSVAPSGLVVVCPQAGRFCAKEVKPGPKWAGGGSGSWASAAYALGLGCSVLLWVSPDTAPPRWVHELHRKHWICSVGGYWWFLQPEKPKTPEPTLF